MYIYNNIYIDMDEYTLNNIIYYILKICINIYIIYILRYLTRYIRFFITIASNKKKIFEYK